VSTSQRGYHHGDLRAALLAAAGEGLESGEPFSMRAVARRAGVSPAAPYRHFADRDALEAALAVEAFDDLRGDLERAAADASGPLVDTVAALGVAYVDFALRRPAVFRLMFGNACDPADAQRVRAAGALHEVLHDVLSRLLPGKGEGLSMALWAMAHGLAFLHLDGKLRPEPRVDVERRVRASVAAIFALDPPTPTADRSER